MNDDEVWTVIDVQRGRTADLLEQLSDEEWRQPSLCQGWTVRDVAAHLTLQQIGLRAGMVLAITQPAGPWQRQPDDQHQRTQPSQTPG